MKQREDKRYHNPSVELILVFDTRQTKDVFLDPSAWPLGQCRNYFKSRVRFKNLRNHAFIFNLLKGRIGKYLLEMSK